MEEHSFIERPKVFQAFLMKGRMFCCGAAAGTCAVASNCISNSTSAIGATRDRWLREIGEDLRVEECMSPDYSWCVQQDKEAQPRLCFGMNGYESVRRAARHEARPRTGGKSFLRVVRGVLLNEFDLLGRNFIVGENRVGRADRHARAAVDATVGIDVKLGLGLELLLVLLGVDAIRRASFYAEFVFGACISDCVRHDCCSPRSGVACHPHRQQSWRSFRQLHCTKPAHKGSVISVTGLL